MNGEVMNVGDGGLGVPNSPLYKVEVYSSIVILYETVSCPPKRGTSWAKGRGQRKTGTKSDISLSPVWFTEKLP